jgi:serine/threonine-protein kinase
MGVVYKARDPVIERVMAIKTVGAGLSNEETTAFEQRFFREAKSAGRLNHPNIVTIYDVGHSEGVAFIAMELLSGKSLRDLLDSGAVLSTEEIANLIAQVADGLDYAHKSDVVHRDVKPANIMVLDNGVAKITDFGVALLPTGALTVAGAVFGSPQYMSPEQVVGRRVDGRSDIFSLGVVLYEMLTGVRPFVGDDLGAVLYKVINETPAPPSTRKAGLSIGFDQIIARALAKHPDDRYQTAAEMATDLRDYANVKAPSTTTARPVDTGLGSVASIETTPVETVSVSDSPAQENLASANLNDWREPAALASPTIPSYDDTRTIQVPVPEDGHLADARTPARKKIWAAYAVVGLLAVSAAGWLALKRSDADKSASDAAPASTAKTFTPRDLVPAPRVPAAETPPPAVTAQPAAPAEAEPVPAPVEKKPATLALAISPWGEIYVNGKKRGISPPVTSLKLPEGKYTIEIRNGDFPAYSQTVELPAAGRATVRHKFQ